MKPRTEELLYLLLWSADQLARPTFRNLTDSFEAWAYRHGLDRQLKRLEARQLLERPPGSAVEAIYRLTEAGRLAALGGRDPEVWWGREWDGQWRMVLFDLPEARNRARVKLRRFLQASHFGYLQNSVWISPDPLTSITAEISRQSDDVESILTLEARPAAGESDESVVAGAWDFDRINQLYSSCLEVLRALPAQGGEGKSQARNLRAWAQHEKAAWAEVMDADPLLPRRLLPAHYRGPEVWRERKRVLARAGELLSTCQ